MNKIKFLIKKSWREAKELNKITNIPLAVIFSYLLDTGKSSSLVRLDSITSKITYPTIAYYYFAHAHYLYGNYDTARKNLNKVLKQYPYHADSTYLLCNIDEIEEKKEAAWKKIISLAHNNQRLKTWLIMANMVNNESEFAILKREWEHAISLKKLDKFHLDINGYIATGALRAKLYSHAIKIWEELLEHIKKHNSIPRNAPTPSNFSRNDAERSLLDLKRLLEKNNIEFFLVSGTLLGCIREARILSHDKDVDIGIWDHHDKNALLTLFRTSGLFYLQASRSEHVMRIKHVNGTAIDVFIHYRDPDNYWHGGVKLKWSNTPFKLVRYPFLKTYFNIPENHDLYLKENYGNWKETKKEFDSSTDTNNSSILNLSEVKAHSLKEKCYSLLND